MCYHKSLIKAKQDLEQRFDAAFEGTEYLPTYHDNGFDHNSAPVLTMDQPRAFTPMQWGLIPHWTKDKATACEQRTKTLNAKSETVFELPSFKQPIQSKRCLVIADGFFEWMEHRGKKFPHYIRLKSGDTMALAGVYDIWRDHVSGEVFRTYSVLTCPANTLMARIHNTKQRMPVILLPSVEHAWLDPQLTQNQIRDLLTPLHPDLMEGYTISRNIANANASQDAAILAPHTYQELSVSQTSLF
ncbi:MAG TPA: SOS response-associated peptidase [Cytophagales bacterium]|nr:SOS response-associated peptidase [Cytophagales bacterium]